MLLHDSDNDASILQRARRGDRQAFAALVRMHQRMVYGMALRMLSRADLAEELAQDVFLKLYHALGDMASAEHLRFWLRRVTSNLAIDRLRQQTAAGRQESLEGVDAAAPPVGDDPLLTRTLQRLLGELSPQARAVVLLRYQQDLDPVDIAATLEMPVNTVKSHLKRSLDSLREQLAPESLR